MLKREGFVNGHFSAERSVYSLVEPVVLAGDALRGPAAVAALLVALGVAVAHHHLVVRVGHDVAALRDRDVVAVERGDRLLGAARRPVVHEARVGVLVGAVDLLRLGVRREGECVDARVRVEARLRLVLDAVRVRLGAVEDELPLGEAAGLVDAAAAAVDDLQRPPALGLLAPEVHAEERPVVEVALDDVARPLEQQRAGGAHRRGEQHAQVAARVEAQRDLALHVLQEAHLVHRVRAPVHVHVRLQRVVGGALDRPLLVDFARCGGRADNKA